MKTVVTTPERGSDLTVTLEKQDECGLGEVLNRGADAGHAGIVGRKSLCVGHLVVDRTGPQSVVKQRIHPFFSKLILTKVFAKGQSVKEIRFSPLAEVDPFHFLMF